MKPRKVVNIRKSLIAGALSVTTLLSGLGFLKGCIPDHQEDSNLNPEPSSSHTIIDDSHGQDQELPGGVVIDPSGKDTSVTNPEESESLGDSTGLDAEHNDVVTSGGQTGSETPGSQAGTPENNVGQTDDENNKVINNGQDETKPGSETIDSSNGNPTDESKEEETKEHVHVLGEWVSISDYLEGSYCPEDGALLSVRAHDYEITDTVFISNDDWTHNITTTEACVNCNHTRTIVQNNVECTNLTLSWDTIYEYQTCNDCGYMKNIGKHNFDKGTTKDGYITYHCTHEGCDYEYSRELDDGRDDNNHTNPGTNTGTNPGAHVHYNGEWISYNDDKEVNYCPEDGYLMGYRDHSYGDGSTTITASGSDSHSITTSHSCANCGHQKFYSSTIACDFTLSGSVTGEDGIITDTYTCANCGNTYTQTRTGGAVDPVDPKDPIKIDVESLISVDPDSLEFVYNGEAHSPTITGIPDNVTPRFVSVQGEDAGDYVWRIEFDTPEGYYADPIEINYTIKPATVSFSYTFDDATGEVNGIYKGVASSDIVSTSYTVNGEDLGDDSLVLDKYGFYKVSSNIEIDQNKLGNYIFPEDLGETSLYEIKRERTWFDIELECNEVDGKLVVDVIWTGGDKLPFDCIYDEEADELIGLCMPILAFNIYFDSSQLSLTEEGLNNERGWDGVMNTEFAHSQEELIRDFITSTASDNWDYDNGLPNQVKVCSFTFDYVPGHENDKDIVIKVDDFEVTTGSDDYNFVYETNASTCIVNPSKETDNVKTVIIDNDLQDDARYNPHLAIEDPDEEEIEEQRQARENLQGYIDSGFDHSYTPGDSEDLDEEDIDVSEVSEMPDAELVESEEGASSAEDSDTLDLAAAYQEYLVSVNHVEPMSFTYEGEEYTLYFDSPVQSLENNVDDFARVLEK